RLTLSRLRSVVWSAPARRPASSQMRSCASIQSELDRVRHSFVGLGDSVDPSPEEVATRHRREKEREEMELARIAAVREAYWANTADVDTLLESMGTALSWALDITEPPKHLRYALFSAIPVDMLCRGLVHGFRDAALINSVGHWSRERSAILRRISAIGC